MATTFSLKQGETRTSDGPIPHPLRVDIYIFFCAKWFNYHFPYNTSTVSHDIKMTQTSLRNGPKMTPMIYPFSVRFKLCVSILFHLCNENYQESQRNVKLCKYILFPLLLHQETNNHFVLPKIFQVCLHFVSDGK